MKFDRLVLVIIIAVFTATIVIADTEIGGAIEGVFSIEGSPYTTTRDAIIYDRDTLQIEPGVRILINQNHHLIIHGLLIAEGTARDSIRFMYNARQGSGGLAFRDAEEGTILNYCVITGGRAASDGSGLDSVSCGGNMFISGGDITIQNSRVSDGYCRAFGAGVCIWNSSPTFESCVISDNSAQENAGGIGFAYGSSGHFINCIISNNEAVSGAGGMYFYGQSSPDIDGCVFIANHTEDSGGAMNINNGSSPHIINCIFLSNTAEAGGAVYINAENTEPLIEWSWFDQNAARVGYQIGGAVYIRGSAQPEMRYNRFTQNNADRGGVFYFKETFRANIHHNLFQRNGATGEGDTGGGGVIATSDDLGNTPVTLNNCTFINNADIGINPSANTADLRGNARVVLNSCILWDEEPYFAGAGVLNVINSNVKHAFEGNGNTTDDPQFYGSDSTWFLLNGNSSCIDNGDGELDNDPDETRNDRGWMYYPQNVIEGLQTDTLSSSLLIEENPSETQTLRFTNNTRVPVYITPMDKWTASEYELLTDITSITADSEINGAAFTEDNFYITGTANGEANMVYQVSRNLAYQGDFSQPGNPGGNGFFDLASDGSSMLYGGYDNYIYEFTTDGEYGDRYSGPDDIRNYTAIGADIFHPYSFLDYYVADEEGLIIRIDSDMWERGRLETHQSITNLGVKWNSRALYTVSEDNIMSLIIPDDELIIPLYQLNALDDSYTIGGIEITQDWEAGRGSLVGIWRGEGGDNDMLFVSDLYTAWLDIRPEERLLMPGEETEWEITFVGNQIPVGAYESLFCLSVNGNGDDKLVYTQLETTSGISGKEKAFPENCQLDPVYPNPFNNSCRLSFQLVQPTDYKLLIVDQSGRTIKNIASGFAQAGFHQTNLDAKMLPSGSYWIRLETAKDHVVQPFTVIK
ncbi:T9SS type A sorting domain-containing protein [bacterium]|nr:T9SS type A sorting domain-containing protein [bacterium]